MHLSIMEIGHKQFVEINENVSFKFTMLVNSFHDKFPE